MKLVLNTTQNRQAFLSVKLKGNKETITQLSCSYLSAIYHMFLQAFYSLPDHSPACWTGNSAFVLDL